MDNENKCYEVTYIVKCRVWDSPYRDNVEELARIFRSTFDKGNLSDYTMGGNIETFKGTIESIHLVPLKHPYKDGENKKREW